MGGMKKRCTQKNVPFPKTFRLSTTNVSQGCRIFKLPWGGVYAVHDTEAMQSI